MTTPVMRGVVEGFYGRLWDWSGRKAILEHMAQSGMNTYLYAPKSDPKHRVRWREPYDDAELKSLAQFVEHALSLDIEPWYAIAPGLDIDPRSDEDLQALVQKLEQLVGVGFRSFALLLDDIAAALPEEQAEPFVRESSLTGASRAALALGRAHVHIANRLLPQLAEQTNWLLCPTHYWGSPFAQSETAPQRLYLQALDDGLHERYALVMTGPAVVPPRIDASYCSSLREFFRAQRRLVLWDNYPVNDYEQARPLLRPLVGRGPELGECFFGVLSNPADDAHASWLPLATCFDFLARPGEYDPVRSLRAAVEQVMPQGVAEPLYRLIEQGPGGLLHMGCTPDAHTAGLAALDGGDGQPLCAHYGQVQRDVATVRQGLAELPEWSAGLERFLALVDAFAASQVAFAGLCEGDESSERTVTQAQRAFEARAWPALMASTLSTRLSALRDAADGQDLSALDAAESVLAEARAALTPEEQFFFSPAMERIHAAERELTRALREAEARCWPASAAKDLRRSHRQHCSWYYR